MVYEQKPSPKYHFNVGYFSLNTLYLQMLICKGDVFNASCLPVGVAVTLLSIAQLFLVLRKHVHVRL